MELSNARWRALRKLTVEERATLRETDPVTFQAWVDRHTQLMRRGTAIPVVAGYVGGIVAFVLRLDDSPAVAVTGLVIANLLVILAWPLMPAVTRRAEADIVTAKLGDRKTNILGLVVFAGGAFGLCLGLGALHPKAVVLPFVAATLRVIWMAVRNAVEEKSEGSNLSTLTN